MEINSNLNLNNSIENTDTAPYLTVVMPAYNEGRNIKVNLLSTSRTLSRFVRNYTIIVINDGSIDNTEHEIISASLLDTHIKYISYSSNQGKGYAIKTGLQSSNANFTAFLDSDLELDPIMLKRFLRTLIDQQADVAIGSKMHKHSKLHYPIYRKILSLGYYVFLKMLFKLNIKDTQTGIKLFRTDKIINILPELSTAGFAFDIELLALAEKNNCKIIELPIELIFSRDGKQEKSKISVKQIINMFIETIKIKYRISKIKNG